MKLRRFRPGHSVLIFITTAALIVGAGPGSAQERQFPEWWVTKRVTSADPFAPDNLAVANLGQLKHFASKACEHMDDHLPGGAGKEIHEMVNAFTPFDPKEPRANFAVVNLGQLKNVAEKFYKRLDEVNYTGFTRGWRPWNRNTPVKKNFAVACIGQVKHVFSFDLSTGGFDEEVQPDRESAGPEKPEEVAALSSTALKQSSKP